MKSVLVKAIALSSCLLVSPISSAGIFFIPIPNLAKPRQLEALIEALEKSDETKAVAFVSEDKTFGQKYWIWGQYSGHVSQAEADRIALEKCQAALANIKGQLAGGQPVYDFGSKKCELYQFVNNKVSAVALQAAQPTPAQASTAAPQVQSALPQNTSAGAWCLWDRNRESSSCVYSSWEACNSAKPSPQHLCTQGDSQPAASANRSVAPPPPSSETGRWCLESPDGMSVCTFASWSECHAARPTTDFRCQAPGSQSRAPTAPTQRTEQSQSVPAAPSSATVATPPAPPSTSPTTSPSSTAVDSPVAKRLRELQQLHKEGLITQKEYEEKRKAVLSTL